jgi:hypothetical protein
MNHLVIEYGHYTAQFGPQDVWLISNGTCMPRTINILPEASKLLIPEDRKWRQEKLYKEMTDRCIDEVVAPLRRLQLTPEELVTLKLGNSAKFFDFYGEKNISRIIMLYYCGNHAHQSIIIINYLIILKIISNIFHNFRQLCAHKRAPVGRMSPDNFLLAKSRDFFPFQIL